MARCLPLIAFALGACADRAPAGEDGSGTGQDSASPPSVPLALIDSTIPPAIAGEAGWNYQQVAEADLTGEGQPERIVLIARVELYRGRPAWDDGQPWQVYVEAPEGPRTYLYAQRLQLGSLALRVGLPAAGQPATIVLLEHLPDRLSIYELSYRGPGQTSGTVRFQREVDPRGETASPRFP